jgi:excinuclease ABC subunit B
MYGDKITKSMAQTIDETERRREKQAEHNREHGLEPKQIVKGRKSLFEQSAHLEDRQRNLVAEPRAGAYGLKEDPVIRKMSVEDLERLVGQTRGKMEQAAKDLDFMEAARLRDEFYALELVLNEKRN